MEFANIIERGIVFWLWIIIALGSLIMLKFVLPAHVEWFEPYKLATDYWPIGVLIVVLFSAVDWVIVTKLTKPTDIESLKDFYRRVRPIGAWGPVREALGEEGVPIKSDLRSELKTWAFATVATFAFVSGIGQLLLGNYLVGIVLVALSTAATYAWSKPPTRTNGGLNPMKIN